MIDIKDKKDCCGCEACVQRCPVNCISLHEDEEGFLYPQVDKDTCIGCGLCEKVCPVINQYIPIEPISVYAAINPNEEIRLQSSSGGIFTMLAEQIIDKGGVVFGVGFNDEWEVVHKFTETKEGLSEFRGSKYVQSRTGDTFCQAEAFLKQGREVLYSGTPCQISGLKHFLRKDYPNLLTVDFICHGVPSPGVFRTYLKEAIDYTARKGRKNTVSLSSIRPVAESDAPVEDLEIRRIAFRDKTLGWKKYSFALVLAKATADGEEIQFCSRRSLRDDPYLKGFMSNLYLRPSCHDCRVKGLSSASDITMGDYWRVSEVFPDVDDEKGVSAVIVNTEKGRDVLQNIEVQLFPSTLSDVEERNTALSHSTPLSAKRTTFFNASGRGVTERVEHLTRLTLFQRVWRKAKHLLAKI